ncbi:MAG: hypothetical protein IPP44_12460 [Ideonella sp.]|nr:hypothetical protein [Ideonella sp.]
MSRGLAHPVRRHGEPGAGVLVFRGLDYLLLAALKLATDAGTRRDDPAPDR